MWLARRFFLAGGLSTLAISLHLAAQPLEETSPGRLEMPVPVLSRSRIQSALDYSIDHRGDALLIVQNNQTLLEEYQNTCGSTVAHRIYSGTKGFWTMAALAASEDGLVSFQERVSEVLPVWQEDSRKSQITLAHLLNFNSGLDPDFHLHSTEVDNRDYRAISDRMVAAPGRAFIYGPSALQVFHEVLKRRLATRNETTTGYLERRVLNPLGLRPQRYLPDQSNNPLLASGFTLTAREWGRMGQCLLHQGRPILTGKALPEVLRGSESNPAFSFGFWNNHLASSGQSREMDIENTLELDWRKQDWRRAALCEEAPGDLIASIGSCGQRLYVVPSLQLVVVRFSQDSNYKDSEFLERLFGK